MIYQHDVYSISQGEKQYTDLKSDWECVRAFGMTICVA